MDAKPDEPQLRSMAAAVGEAWATEIVHSLRSVDREIIGAWPGTLREARMRIRGSLRSRIDLNLIEELAHVAYLSARRAWQVVSEADHES